MRIFVLFLATTLLIIPTFVDADAQSQDLEFALMDAAASGETDVVKELLDRGVNIETKNKLGATSLTWAAQAGHLDVVELLLERGADVNVKTTTAITPLMAAVSAGHADVVKLLLIKGADASVGDHDGNTPLDVAEAKGYTQVAALLRSVDKIRDAAPVSASDPTVQDRTEVIREADNLGGLTVRAEPSSRGQAIAYLPVGSTVTYLGQVSDGWVKLTGPIPGGWVQQSYLGSRSPEASVVDIDYPEQCLRIRSGPGTSHEKIGCLPRGTKLKLTGTVQNNWAQMVEPMAGWVTIRQIRAPALFPRVQATSGARESRRDAADDSVYLRQQSDRDFNFEKEETEADEAITELRRESQDAGSVPVVPPQRGVLRIGPLGVGLPF